MLPGEAAVVPGRDGLPGFGVAALGAPRVVVWSVTALGGAVECDTVAVAAVIMPAAGETVFVVMSTTMAQGKNLLLNSNSGAHSCRLRAA